MAGEEEWKGDGHQHGRKPMSEMFKSVFLFVTLYVLQLTGDLNMLDSEKPSASEREPSNGKPNASEMESSNGKPNI